MARTGKSLQSGEAEKIIKFVINRARNLQKRTIEIMLQDLYPLLKTETEPNLRDNRIRWKMKKQFRDAKIIQKFKGDRYVFILDDSIDINLTKSTKDIVSNLPTLEKTTSKWKEEFIAPAWFGDVIDILNMGFIPILYGPPGCGKSRILEQAFMKLGRISYRIPLGQITDPQELVGTTHVVQNENGVSVTKFVGGFLTHALEPEGPASGAIMDEFDCCTESTGPAINNFLEPESILPLMTEKGVEMFERHPQSLLAATANTAGWGDDTGNFAGADRGNSASWDRLWRLPCDYDHEIEKKLISRHVPKKVVEALYNDKGPANTHGIIITLRKSIARKDFDAILGLRPILRFAQTWKVMGWNKGLFYLIHQVFRPEYHENVTKIIIDRFGNNLGPSRNTWDNTKTDYIPNGMQSVIDAGLGH